VTERERVIRLNGIGGVRFQKPGSNFDPGFFVEALQRQVIPSEVEESLICFGSRTEIHIQRCFALLNMTNAL
jgi:hypothetical protein